MFTSVKNFVCRHRRKFLITGAVVGGLTFAARYAHRKLFEWQEKELNQFLERSQRQQHFERNENTCNQTILSLTPTLCEEIGKLLDTEMILDKLKTGSVDKIALWEELKIISFARLSVMLYAGTMFVIMLRIQVNIIGGHLYNYLTSHKPISEMDKKFQEDYLSLCEYFIKNGIKDLCSLIETKVQFVLEGESLKKQLRLQDIEHYFWAIQSTVSSDPDDPLTHLSKYMLPKEYVTEFTSNKSSLMSHLVNETIEILETTEIKSLARSSVNRGLAQMMDKISEFYDPITRNDQIVTPGTSSVSSLQNNNVGNKFVDFSKITLPMAKVVPIINGLSSAAKSSGVPKVASDRWIKSFVNMPNLKMLGANVYESFSNSALS